LTFTRAHTRAQAQAQAHTRALLIFAKKYPSLDGEFFLLALTERIFCYAFNKKNNKGSYNRYGH
jgi:hypothetical protein